MIIYFETIDVTTSDRHLYRVKVNEILFDQPFVVAAIGILNKTKAQGSWVVENAYINYSDSSTIPVLYNDDNDDPLMTLEDVANQATPATIGEVTVCGMRILEI